MEFDFSLISDLAIGGVALVPVIIGIVSILKKFAWFKSDYAPYAAATLSVIGYVAVKVLEAYPVFIAYAEPVAYSVFLFLVVSGAYQLSKSRK
jgi:hypothetical protein